MQEPLSVSRAAVVALLALVAACSTSKGAPADGGESADAHVRDPNANCVKPGTKNNEVGVGAYCEPRTPDCAFDGGVRFCSGAFNAPETAWFCTRPCSVDGDCGKGAYCAHDPRGVACVPIVCGGYDGGAADAASE